MTKKLYTRELKLSIETSMIGNLVYYRSNFRRGFKFGKYYSSKNLFSLVHFNKIRKFRHLEKTDKSSGHLDIWTHRKTDIRTSGTTDRHTFEHSDNCALGISGHLDSQKV